MEAEFEFWVEHLNAADLISVTRRLGRRRRCHDDDERKNLSYPHAAATAAAAAAANMSCSSCDRVFLLLLLGSLDRSSFALFSSPWGTGHMLHAAAATTVKIFEFLMQPQRGLSQL